MAVADFSEQELRSFVQRELDASRQSVLARQGQGAQADLDGRTTALEGRTTALEALDGLHLIGAAGEPAFQNAWVNFGGTEPSASFYRDRGRVYLAGTVKSGVLGVPMFTLPAGYRPPADTVRFGVVDGTATPAGVVILFASGDVWLSAGNNTYVSLAPISFRVA